MPINLLGAPIKNFPSVSGMFNKPAAQPTQPAFKPAAPPAQSPAAPTGFKAGPAPAGTFLSPIGVTAKTPNSAITAAPTTLPKPQQNPIVQPPPTPTPTYQTPSQAPTNPAPTFSGLLGQSVNTAMNGAPQANDYAQQAANYGAGSIPIAAQARDIANQFGQKYADIGQQGARFEAGQLTTGTTPVAEGNAAITAQTTAAQQQALAQGEQAALQGIGYQLTGQQQAAQAAQNASGVPLSIYGTKLGALQNAYNAAKPELGSPYQIPFSPLNQGQGSPLGSETPGGLNGLAQNYGTFQGIQSGAQALAAAQGTGQAQGISAAAAAPGQAQASNIQTAGTAGTNTWNGIYNNAQTQAATISQQQSAINAIGNQALTMLANDPALNRFALQYGNKTLNNLQTQLSDPQYSAFNTAIQSLQARIGAALQAGEIPTAATGNAQSIANGNLTLNALASTLKQVDSEMGTFASTQQSLADYAKSQFGTGGGGSQSDPLGIL